MEDQNVDCVSCLHCGGECELGMERLQVCCSCAEYIASHSELEGTIKQVVWAESIREGVYEKTPDMVEAINGLRITEDDIEPVFENTESDYWIRKIRNTSDYNVFRFIVFNIVRAKVMADLDLIRAGEFNRPKMMDSDKLKNVCFIRRFFNIRKERR